MFIKNHNKTVPLNTILFSSDFPPQDGGVANYALEVSKALTQASHLKRIITYNALEEITNPLIIRSQLTDIKRDLGQKRGDKISLFRIVNTLMHYIHLFAMALIEWEKQTKRNDYIVAVSCYGYKQIIQLSTLALLNRQYTLILHGLDILSNRKQFALLFNYMCKKATRIVVNSKATQELLLSFNVKLANKCHIQHPIVNIQEIEQLTLLPVQKLSERFNIPLADKTLFFSAARLIKRKGIDIAINTLADLHHEFPNICFLIAGKGEEYESLQKQIIKLHAEHYIYLLGYISEQEKFSILNESNFFIMPTNSQSNTDFEGFGISFIEASLFNNVVIGGSHGGVSEAIKDFQTGRIFDFDTTDSLSELSAFIRYLLTDNTKLKQYQEQGREYVSTHFSQMEYTNFIPPSKIEL